MLHQSRHVLSPEVYKEMASRWPSFCQEERHGIHVRVEVESRLQEEVFDFLAEHGKRPWWKKYPMLGLERFFLLQGERIFDQLEIAGAELVTLGNRKMISNMVMYHDDCDVWVDGQTIDPGTPFGGGGGSNLPILTEDARLFIQSGGWTGFVFRPVEIKDPRPNQGKLWLMWPECELPAMINEVVDSSGKPFDPATSDQCMIQDLYSPWLYRYSKESVESSGQNCVFRTHERFGANKTNYGYATRKPDIIVRRAFAEWLKSYGLIDTMVPVLLE